jgi:hypothetical protein
MVSSNRKSTHAFRMRGRQHRAKRSLAGIVVVAAFLFGAVQPAVATTPTPPTLTVVILGSGSVVSQPVGIACPGKCTATFTKTTTVGLTAKSKNGSTFLRWGGSCTGTGTCRVKVSGLTAVAAQFVAGTAHSPGKAVAAPGPYSGADVGSITFDVAPGGRKMLNVFVRLTYLTCHPSGAINDHLGILEVPIKANGSFSATTSQKGVLQAGAAVFTYKIAGHFQAATATTSASAAGTWREDIAFASGTTTSCTSNEQSWTATNYREPPQKIVAVPGPYSGGSITFSVAPGGKSMLNVSVPLTYLTCDPSGAINDHFAMLQVAIRSDGSFSATTSQEGVLSGSNAKFTYTLKGYFEGPTPPGGAPTAAGIWREDIVFASGTTKMCTSNNQLWTATRA